ncbi:MAG: UvrABC system protein C [Alphaproteobacteria bacterium MarineAlpha9_Bin4]|nr:MAG: UvrABC system protein C [Alphaproteobacteria bacterium MarineAlpha9_Bin4]
MQKGINNIKKVINKLPNSSGVYKMISLKNEILYIGKAKNLFKRVNSYTNPMGLNNRLQKMISLIEKVEFISTEDETKALLLEASLIKEIKPKFNILLKDDKTYPNIELRVGHKWPQIKKHRGKKNTTHAYFGPFASAYHVNVTLDTLQKIFSLRTCSDYELLNRKRPCIQFQIHRCSAPCTGNISVKDYKEIVDGLLNYMNGKDSNLVNNLITKMNKASKELNYEKAANIRDKIRSLEKTNHTLQNLFKNIEEADIFSLVNINQHIAVEVTFCRNSQNFGSNTHFVETKIEDNLTEILQKFLVQFYTTQNIPKNIIISHDIPEKKLLESAFYRKTNSKISISIPKKNNIKIIVEDAKKRAEINLAKRLAELEKIKNLLGKLKNKFNFKNNIDNIEVYDNSHFSGKEAVGSFIVANKEGFLKDKYRKFNIRNSNTHDDYSMMEEVISRRIKYGDLPDLIIIDGGKGQLSKAKEAFLKSNLLNINIISISKGKQRNSEKERFYSENGREVHIEKNDPLFYYLLRLRDEAHRFAINNHKILRKKNLFTSEIDMIPNIGAKRKKNLLLFFKNVEELKNASFNRLCKVPGISKATAKQISIFFEKS